MMEKIIFVRYFKQYGEEWYDVFYVSGRVQSYIKRKLPKTAKAFLDHSTKCKEQYDGVFKRTEYIYTIE